MPRPGASKSSGGFRGWGGFSIGQGSGLFLLAGQGNQLCLGGVDGIFLVHNARAVADGELPHTQGKSVLFKRFAGVDAVPICLDTQDTEELITTIKNLAPAFGGINLEASCRIRASL